MKVVINKCYGGFSLSPRATKRWAELHGRQCHFYKLGTGKDRHAHMPISVEEIDRKSWGTWVSYDIPNVDEVLPSQANWNERTLEDRQASNRLWDAHSIDSRPDDRSDPLLVQVVEELGEEANGAAANLRVVEIPDGTAFEISDYDGIESVHETHEVWG